MPDDKGKEVSRIGLNNLDKEWMNYQKQSQYFKDLQRKEVGILRDAKSGPAFYKYVRDEIDRAPDKTVCADNIAKELTKDKMYLINASTNLDGRKGLQYLQPYLSKNNEGNALSNNIANALKLWKDDAAKATTQIFEQNQKNFKENFQKFEKDLKTQLDTQGIQVDRAYYKEFTGSQWEIRAEVRQFIKGLEVETSGSGKGRIYTGSRDILIGGYDASTGKFVSKPTMEKLGTTETSAIQLDDLLIIVQAARKAGELLGRQLGKGLAREATDLAKTLGKDALNVGVKEGGKDTEKILSKSLVSDAQSIGREARITTKDLSKTLKRESPPRQESSGRELSKGGDTNQDLGDTLNRSNLRSRPPAREAPPPDRGSATRAPSPYSEMDIATIGEDAATKARDLGITRGEMSSYLDDVVWKAGNIDDQARFVSGLAGEQGREVARKEINNIYSLGRDTTRRLMDYGYTPTNLSNAVEAGKVKELATDQIRQGLNNELKLMDHLKTRYCGNDLAQARAELKVGEDPRRAIQNRIWGDSWKEWKRLNPRSDELPTEMRSAKMGELADKAADLTKAIEKRLLGTSSRSLIIPGVVVAKKEKEKSDNIQTKKDREEKKEQEIGNVKTGSQKDFRGAESKDTKSTETKQIKEQQAKAKKESDERELKKAAAREAGSNSPKESKGKETSKGESKKEKKDAPASGIRSYK